MTESRTGKECIGCGKDVDEVVHMGNHKGEPLCQPCAVKFYPHLYAPDPFDTFQSIIDCITYKPGWRIRTGFEDDRMWLQVQVSTEAEISFDVQAQKRIAWSGAKHFLSKHMCRNEIVSTVFHAFERAELHELREWFRYKGRSIFNPHLDPDALVEVARYSKNFNVRENAMTMQEPE